MIIMSAPAQEAGSARSALGTPRNVASGPYIPPSRAMALPPGSPYLPEVDDTGSASPAGEQPCARALPGAAALPAAAAARTGIAGSSRASQPGSHQFALC